MGKKKQKVRWCTVDGLKWSTNEDESSPEGSVTGKMSATTSNGYTTGPAPGGGGGGQSNYNSGHGRRSSQPWVHGGVAPRFEKRSQGGNRQVYYDGEYCDAEEMPNGFTKIRSKNLDILFKREYYEQKLSHTKPKEPVDLPGAKPDEAIIHNSENSPDSIAGTEGETSAVLPAVSTVDDSGKDALMKANKPLKPVKSLDQIDPSEIPEFRPMNSTSSSVDLDPEARNSDQSSPYYPTATAGNYYPSTDQSAGPYNYSTGAPPRPNLYLYSPSSNTLIPCEEIVIPNPVMSGEGGAPVYAGGGGGPTNIYLAYPVSGPDGRGYITQPFSPPLPPHHHHHPQHHHQPQHPHHQQHPHNSNNNHQQQHHQQQQQQQQHHDYTSYTSFSPSISVDGSQYHSSTPQTPNSGQDSGSSTQPTSPPPLVNYHPANWIPADFNQDRSSDHSSTTSSTAAAPSSTAAMMSPPTMVHEQHVPSTVVSAPCNGAGRTVKIDRIEQVQINETPTVQYIPGLPPDTNQRKAQKKKKKKKLLTEHRDSLSSEAELSRIYASTGQSQQQLQQQQTVVPVAVPLTAFCSSYNSSPVMEVNLTDDLADDLVNPPTDPECSDEETLRNSCENLTANEKETTSFADLPRDDTICNLEELAAEEENFPAEAEEDLDQRVSVDPEPVSNQSAEEKERVFETQIAAESNEQDSQPDSQALLDEQSDIKSENTTVLVESTVGVDKPVSEDLQSSTCSSVNLEYSCNLIDSGIERDLELEETTITETVTDTDCHTVGEDECNNNPETPLPTTEDETVKKIETSSCALRCPETIVASKDSTTTEIPTECPLNQSENTNVIVACSEQIPPQLEFEKAETKCVGKVVEPGDDHPSAAAEPILLKQQPANNLPAEPKRKRSKKKKPTSGQGSNNNNNNNSPLHQPLLKAEALVLDGEGLGDASEQSLSHPASVEPTQEILTDVNKSTAVTTIPVVTPPPTSNPSLRMSYSAVCKTSDPRSSQTAKPESNNSNNNITPATILAAAVTAPTPPYDNSNTPQSVPNKPNIKPEEWESVPDALITTNPGGHQWEAQRKRDKKRRKKNPPCTVNFDESPPTVESYEPEEEEFNSLPALETVATTTTTTTTATATVTSDRNNNDSSCTTVADVTSKEASPLVELEEFDERKRTKKKKKKLQSEEPEEKGHRVFICDNQIEIRFSRSVRRASEVLGADQLDAARHSGYCDILLVEKLGCGITRGSMHIGRLYQGRYVPPDRVDGLLPIKQSPTPLHVGEEESNETDASPAAEKDENQQLQESADQPSNATIITATLQAAEIDLD